MDLPELEYSHREDVWKKYTDSQKILVIYNYLFEGHSHRKMEIEILGGDDNKAKGYQAMSILHYLGMKKPFKNIFSDMQIEEAIELLYSKDKPYHYIANYLKLYIDEDRPKIEYSTDDYYKPISEGKVKQYNVTRYERSPINRAKAIAIHGYSCKVCGFNFGEFYGSHGESFIEIHHLEPLSSVGKQVDIDPVTDLIPVCSNCHSMLHRGKNVLKVEELKSIIYDSNNDK